MECIDNSSNCTLSGDDKATVVYVILGCSGFALLCSLIVLVIMLLFKKYRVSTQRLILYLMLTVTFKQAMLVTLGLTSRYNNILPYCMAAGFFNQQLSWYVPMAIYCLTFDLFVKAVFQWQHTEKYEKWYVAIIFLLPFTFNWVPFINQAYGVSGAVCWIRDRNETDCTLFLYGVVLQFALYWGPFLVALLCILVACIWALVVTKKRRLSYNGTFDPGEHHIKLQLEKDVRHYQLYPVVYLLITIIQPVRLILAAVEPPGYVLSLYILHGVLEGLEGVLICLAFLLSYVMRKELWWRGGLRAAISSIKSRERVSTYNAIQVDTTDSLNQVEH